MKQIDYDNKFSEIHNLLVSKPYKNNTEHEVPNCIQERIVYAFNVLSREYDWNGNGNVSEDFDFYYGCLGDVSGILLEQDSNKLHVFDAETLTQIGNDLASISQILYLDYPTEEEMESEEEDEVENAGVDKEENVVEIEEEEEDNSDTPFQVYDRVKAHVVNWLLAHPYLITKEGTVCTGEIAEAYTKIIEK